MGRKKLILDFYNYTKKSNSVPFFDDYDIKNWPQIEPLTVVEKFGDRIVAEILRYKFGCSDDTPIYIYDGYSIEDIFPENICLFDITNCFEELGKNYASVPDDVDIDVYIKVGEYYGSKFIWVSSADITVYSDSPISCLDEFIPKVVWEDAITSYKPIKLKVVSMISND